MFRYVDKDKNNESESLMSHSHQINENKIRPDNQNKRTKKYFCPFIFKSNYMIIDNNMVVSVNYRLTVNEGNSAEELVEETNAENPFVFLFGVGGLLEEFEGNLRGLKAGDSFDFIIKAENGYGGNTNENVVRIPLAAFVAEGEELDTDMVQPGNFLPMVDDQGNQMQGLVVDVNDEFVTMDFNHPLAGKDLHFAGSVNEIREASAEELAHGHVHGAGGHHH